MQDIIYYILLKYIIYVHKHLYINLYIYSYMHIIFNTYDKYFSISYPVYKKIIYKRMYTYIHMHTHICLHVYNYTFGLKQTFKSLADT